MGAAQKGTADGGSLLSADTKGFFCSEVIPGINGARRLRTQDACDPREPLVLNHSAFF
jgi:hypothetical protein